MLKLSKADIARANKVKIKRDDLVRHGVAKPKQPDSHSEICDRIDSLKFEMARFQEVIAELRSVVDRQQQIIDHLSKPAPERPVVPYRFDVVRDSDGKMIEVNAIPSTQAH